MEWTEVDTREIPALNLVDHRTGRPLPRPSVVYEATAFDGTALRLAVAGSGRGRDPFALQLETVAALEDAPVRMPTLEEIQAALDRFTLEGAVFDVGNMASRGPEAPAPDVRGSGSFVAVQVGATDGTPAGMRMELTGGLRLVDGRPSTKRAAS